MSVKVSVYDFDEWKIVRIQGRMDALAWRGAWTALQPLLVPGPDQIGLDLSQVDFISFQSLNRIVEAGLLLKSAGGDLVLIGPVAQVRKHLDSFVGHKSLKIFRNLEELRGGLIFTPRSEYFVAEAPSVAPLGV